MSSLVPIATPVALLGRRAQLHRVVADAWTEAPPWLVDFASRLLANSRMPSDALLQVADALEDARVHARTDGRLATAAGLGRIADIFREVAPCRADVPLGG
jgi:hypothetical protein